MVLAVALTLTTYLFMQQKSFGRLPSSKRLERLKQSPNYRDGSFQNVSDTPMLSEDASYPNMLYNFFFGKGLEREPDKVLPSVKTDLKSLSPDVPSITWFGHSSYLITLNGKFILVDPVFSERASPVQYAGSKAYPVTNPYSIDDFPAIDVVIISHDHYDHLDYNTILKLKGTTKVFCVGLGVGEHLSYWGVEEDQIKEFDWWESSTVFPGLELTSAPARHFSGRGFSRNQTLWTAFVLKSGGKTIFIGGDSGYDASFKKIGDTFGPFDLAMLECGQYDVQWPYIHMMPEETVHAAIDLQSGAFMPVHWGKFTLANHSWKEPVERAKKQADVLNVRMTTPMIGERISLDSIPVGSVWWR